MYFLLSYRNAAAGDVFRQDNCIAKLSLTLLSLCVHKRGAVIRLGLMLVTLSLAYIRFLFYLLYNLTIIDDNKDDMQLSLHQSNRLEISDHKSITRNKS